MKRLIAVSFLVATNAMAIDFETEWAKFEQDFSRFKSYQVAKVNTRIEPKEKQEQPIISKVPVEELPENEVVRVDPRSPDRLGHKLEDPAMREKVTSLYKKPDVIVYSATIR
jgi:hypothetical protein